ncbi:hypothetical protein [Streptomyces sp. NPDC057582]|uniref:hypothetical protein n=1 Tax=Streptomyces sp. NPDC057582 TaxID=3346174 RepID=UPI0036AAC349
MTATIPQQVRSRHLASLRTPPLPCGNHRDPALHQVAPHGRSTYGLTARELLAERSRLLTAGWTPGEVDARLKMREARAA